MHKFQMTSPLPGGSSVRLVSVLSFLLSISIAAKAETEEGAWNSLRLTGSFFAEGAGVGDIDGDGKVDVVYGPHWWAGPDFSESHRFADGESFEGTKGYSDNFFCYTLDANGDGKTDVLVYGFPGKEARLYLNPGAEVMKPGWEMKVIAPEISNESPAFVDIVPGGLPEIICTKETSYGFYQAGEDATEPWIWRAISGKGQANGRFEHGLGVGDLNGDGRLDILQREHWFENPGKNVESSGEWKKHRWSLPAQSGGAQILVHDYDGDGDSDIVTSLRAHGYGLAWFEQYEPGKFQPHQIMGESSQDNPHGVCFSQLHALALADIDKDGRMDFVTGKRKWAHQGKDPGGMEAPVLYWFRNSKTDDGIEFVPHFVDDQSGVGVEVKVADLNGDSRLDIISSNKLGLSVHLQGAGDILSAASERWKAPNGRSQDDYGTGLNPDDALDLMSVPDGFSVDLIAAEPDITQPIAMCFDDRGRIWVVEGHTYPQRADEGKGKDRILILEDTTGDGNFDSRKVFAEGINLASGIEVGFGGVFVGAAPNLLFFSDANRDDVPDGDPEILLDGWGYQDTHETLNSFTWGPDGWLYGCHGVFTHSNVGKPGAPDLERTKLNAGVWRFHPVNRTFEVFAHGTSNPWGLDFNEYGDFFVSACVIPHFFHLSHGGLYHRQAGQHFNPWTFDDIKTIADHSHYVGNIRDHAFWGENKIERRAAPTDTSALGGGHAHCGLAFYQSAEFPARFRGEVFFHNLHGHRIVRENLEPKGSGYTARHRPDFVLTNNHEFVGVGVMLGPDGALYFSDWGDSQTCHHRDVDIWDRSTGRIFRVRYGNGKSTRLNLTDKTDVELVALLGDENGFIARQSQRILQERAASRTLDRQETDEALVQFEEKNSGNTPLRLRALWTRHVTDLLPKKTLIKALGDENEYLRGWAVQLADPGADFIAKFEAMAKEEKSLIIRRYLASKLQTVSLESRWGIAENLAADILSGHDPNIPLLVWYGIEPLVEEDADRAFSIRSKTKWPLLKEFISRRAVVTPTGREAILSSMTKAENAKDYLSRATGLIEALRKLPPVEVPKGWISAKERGADFQKNERGINTALQELGVRFGDAEFFPELREVVRSSEANPSERVRALKLLTTGGDPDLGLIARDSLQVPALREAALIALRDFRSGETANAVVAVLPELPLKLRNEAINLLASRPEMTLILLKAVDAKKVQPSLVSPVMLGQFERFENEKINSLVSKNWTRMSDGVELEQLSASIEEWKKKLSPEVMNAADAARGRQTYRVTCGTCHQLFGEGIALGPDLTGSNRADIGYVLENVLAPSAVVGNDYLLNIFTMRDGSVVSGMIQKTTPDFFHVSMPGGGLIDVKKTEVINREELKQSLMQAGLFDALPIESVADLVKYLASSQQVALPGEKRRSTTVAPPAEGVIRIEGESLVEKWKPGGGVAVSQAMAGFGTGWSGNAHLWWRGGQPGDIYTLKLPDLEPGTKAVTIFPTTARDYAIAKFAINGQLQEMDFYTEQVLPGEPLIFKGINVSPTEPLQIDIHLVGKNENAVPNYMVGIDRIEIASSSEKEEEKE